MKNQNLKFQVYATTVNANKISNNVIDFTEKKIQQMIKKAHHIKITDFLSVLKYYCANIIAVSWVEGKLVFVNLVDYNDELL